MGNPNTPKTGEGGLQWEEPKREEGKCRRLVAAEGVHSPPLRSTGASATGDGAGEFCTQLAVTCGSIGVENDGPCSDIAPE